MITSRQRKFSALISLVALAVLTSACGWFFQVVEPTANPTEAPTNTPVVEIIEPATVTVQPTRIVIQTTPTTSSGSWPTLVSDTASETLADYDCIRWDQIDHSYVGEIVCVFGIIDSIETIGFDQYTYFSDNTDATSLDFRLRAIEAVYYGLREGDCISIEGVVRSNGDNSFVFINPASLSQEGEVYTYDDLSICD